MSVAAKLTFGACCATTVATIVYVHYKQSYDREQLHQGVLRDIERQQRRKMENLFRLQQQSELAKLLEKEDALNKENT